MKTLKYTGINIALIIVYFLIGKVFGIKDHDGTGAVITFLALLLGHIIVCFLTGVMMHMRGKNDLARIYFFSASAPIVMGGFLYIMDVMGF